MPLYEYKCNKCSEVFEVLQRFSDAPVRVHDGCGGKVSRLLTAPNFQFKGTGFYVTDYPNKHDSSPAHDSNVSNSSSDSKSSDGAGSNGKEASKPGTSEPASKTEKANKPAPAASSSEK